MTGPVVSNASPLIALDQIGQLALLELLFQQILVPSAVVSETTPPLALPTWIIEKPLSKPLDPRTLATGLGSGEREAMALALELNAAWIVLDDRAARNFAQKLGIPVIGTLGVLLAGKRHGYISAVLPHLDTLKAKGFFISQELYDLVRIGAGEEP